LRALEALGYVAGATGSVPADSEDELALFDPVGPNPIEHVREIQLTTQAIGLVQTGQHEKVERVIRTLLAEAGERSQHFVWAHAHLAGALAAQGKLEEALEHFEVAAQNRPDDGQMHTMKGIVLQALGRTDEAIASFRQAISLEPVFAITHLNFGIALTAAGETDKAIEQYRLAIEKDPQMMRAHAKLAELLARSNRLDEALAALDRAVKIANAAGDTQAVRQFQALRRRYQQEKLTGKAP
jgi:tetratricopeptide (TPR) repeat protein